jgi:hypothetical protein
LKPGNAISSILSIQKIKKLLKIIYHYLVVEKSNNLNKDKGWSLKLTFRLCIC